MIGKNNISLGFITMGFFMLYGFLLIYMHDFAPDKAEWIQSYVEGTHFESRLAHVHGNLFAIVNIIIGYLLLSFQEKLNYIKPISILALIGMLMPIGILAEVYLSAPPLLVLIGAISLVVAVFGLGYSFFTMKQDSMPQEP